MPGGPMSPMSHILGRMVLDVSVGVALQPAALHALQAALADHGVTWREPHGAAVPPMRVDASGMPYSSLHRLRRVLTLLDREEPVTPLGGPQGIGREDDGKVLDQTLLMYSHLLCHSDCDGYYVPVDFGDPLFLPEEGVAGGGMVGSSQGLLAELRRCAPTLGIRLDADGHLSDAEAERLNRLPPEGGGFAVEARVWLTLYEACRASLASGHLIVFH
jgi:hypothetical protein